MKTREVSVSLAHGEEQLRNRRLLLAHLPYAVGFTLAGAGWLLINEPTPVVRGTVPLNVEAPFSFMISAFPFLGILAAEALSLWRLGEKRASLVLVLQVGCICLLSAVRLAYCLPISGHVLLVAFFILYSLGTRRTLVRTAETLIAGVVLCALLATKLIAWRDWQTPTIALGIAAALWSLGILVARNRRDDFGERI